MNKPLSPAEREKLINQLIDFMNKSTPSGFFSYKIIAENIVDSGWRPTSK